jgi:hypothetical protein
LLNNHQVMDAKKLYSPEELYHYCYDQCNDRAWNASKIGTFFSAYLLDGLRDFKNNKALISLESYYALVEYSNNQVVEKMMELNNGKRPLAQNLLTPDELMNRFPNVATIGWDTSKIGVFFKSSLLMGYVAKHDKKALIIEDSFRKLIDYASSNLLKRSTIPYH